MIMQKRVTNSLPMDGGGFCLTNTMDTPDGLQLTTGIQNWFDQ